MTFKEIEASCNFQCAHCENSKEEAFSNLQSIQNDCSVKIWVKNLPHGISQSGLKNLFITVGKPLSINYFVSSNSALVEFDCLRKYELAKRDLNCKPPYNLTLSLDNNKRNQSKGSPVVENWDFSNSKENVLENLFQTKEKSEEKNEQLVTSSQSYKIINKLGYDPSIRMRQRKLDFKSDIKCISMGRGYLNMGEVNRYIGGLQTFTLSSENSKAEKEVSLKCQFCKASTTKMCPHCLKSYCSKDCLSKSTVDHQGNCSSLRNDNKVQSEDINDFECNLNQQDSFKDSLESLFLDAELISGCTVIMSTYLTMQSVFVRRSHKKWEKNFTRFCNDVAEVALKSNKLESIPKSGDLYIAKFYKDNCFYRAKVISVDKKTAEVVFVDFGNSQETNFDDLKPLPQHLKSVPELAVKVRLHDMAEGSSIESVDYFNRLTAERIPLILEFKKGSNVVLKEEDSKAIVNEIASNYILPSWKKDSSVTSKLGAVFYKDSLSIEKLEIGETYTLILCHFDEKEFTESDVLWVLLPDTDHFFHVNTEMHSRVTEYCEFLKNDYYLPRVNELCLVRDEGKWQRCINLKSHGTTCCVFFVDDGHSSLVKTSNIRKMIQDFTEVPAQAICCTLPVNSKLKENKELHSKVVDYLKTQLGQRIDSIRVLKLLGDAYCLIIPEIEKMLA